MEQARVSGTTLTALPTTSWPTNGGNLYNQRRCRLYNARRG